MRRGRISDPLLIESLTRIPSNRLIRAAYVHVPFCAHRCGYCNFAVVAGRDDLVDSYLAALERELAGLEEPHEVDTLFLGGGTPTQLEAAALERLLGAVTKWLPPAAGCEFSVEANPADVDAQKVDVLSAHGVNRVSLGAQSFDDAKLRILERLHTGDEVRRAFSLLRPRVHSVSLDLIFAAPDETLAQWRRDLDQALRLKPDHVSTYGLTYERGTRFWSRRRHGELASLDEETERGMYAEAIDVLQSADYEHYEVSNFARPGHRCRHNEVYWAGGDYLAFGPGAARHTAGRREVNHRSTSTYLRRVLAGQSPVAEVETLDAEDRAREALVLGLRRLGGIEPAAFAKRTGFTVEALAGAEVARFRESGLLDDSSGNLRLTRKGLFVSDALWPYLLRR